VLCQQLQDVLDAMSMACFIEVLHARHARQRDSRARDSLQFNELFGRWLFRTSWHDAGSYNLLTSVIARRVVAVVRG
jgi:hypothetical protein